MREGRCFSRTSLSRHPEQAEHPEAFQAARIAPPSALHAHPRMLLEDPVCCMQVKCLFRELAADFLCQLSHCFLCPSSSCRSRGQSFTKTELSLENESLSLIGPRLRRSVSQANASHL